jgi:TolA-binding protein
MGFGILVIGYWLLFGYWCLMFGISPLFAQDDLAQLKESYFKENRYSEFVDYLKIHKKDNPLSEVSYFIALSRYEQLRYLEEEQQWDEYFNLGEEYRQELIQEVLNAVRLTSKERDSLSVYARCLLWQFHKDMKDAQEEAALADLLSAVEQYSGLADVDLSAVKYVADRLSDYGDRLNSQRVYNIYLETSISSPEFELSRLISLAKQLAYRDNNATSKPFLAESVFKKIDELNPDLILDQQTQYLRAYNLEKLKQYRDAHLQYQALVKNYPQNCLHYPEAIFKMGVISAYILSDIPAAQGYFTELTQGPSLAPQVFASFYQLGLISQYQGEILKARGYYHTLLEKSRGVSCCSDLISKTKIRLKEIEERQPLEFNLQAFMDASLKYEGDVAFSPNVDIRVGQFKLTPNRDVGISSFALPAASGCSPVNLEYLWSGDLGSEKPGSDQHSFTNRYVCPGTKLIQLTVITPTGTLDRNLVFIDVNKTNNGI